jgi:hypothetical protein
MHATGLPTGDSPLKQPVTTRVVEAAEIDQVMRFLRTHWNPNHILGRDREFLLWQLSPERCRGFEQAGLSAAALWAGDELVGILGAIGCRFNGNGTVIDGAWLCNLLVLPQYRALGGFMRLMSFVHRLPISVVGVVRFVPAVHELYRAMRYHIGDRLFRFVRIVDPVQTAQIAVGQEWNDKTRLAYSQISVSCSLKSATALNGKWDRFWQRFTQRGYFGTNRDSGYMTWRYLAHPRLKHVVKLAETAEGEICGAAVYRVEQVKDHPVRVMRLLELMALDEASYERLIGAIARDADELGVAFVDHFTTRSLHSIFKGLGWHEEQEFGDAILPSLFQPLVQARREVNFGIRLLGASDLQRPDLMRQLHIVKSDSDQDRPS